MGKPASSPLIITNLRGRDRYSVSEITTPTWKARDMINVDLYRAALARRRGGAIDVLALTTGEAFTGVISAMGRHVAGAVVTAAELWAIDDAATPVVQRLTGGTVWTSPSIKDNLSGSSSDAVFCSFKGKLYVAYDSAQDRLHCWDPNDSSVRRTGLATPAAATVANTGGGAYAATLRYYKIRYVKKSGSTYLLASELSANVSFTPSGAGTAARITKPAAITEGETHWQVFASADDNLYFNIAETVVGTTTYDDSATPSAYNGDAPPLVGTHTNWTSVKYLIAADDHLIGAGSWESGGAASRVWWSGVTNQTGIGDDESVIQTVDVSNYADLDENDGSAITGLGGPIDGRTLVFKRNQIWALIPTGQDSPFYRPIPITKGLQIGCLRQQTIVHAEDERGRPCVYFLSEQGPYRYGADGLQALVDDIQDRWDLINLEATAVVAHGVWHAATRQVWWWIAQSGDNFPSYKLVFDTRLGRVGEDGRVRDGWVTHTGSSARARCSVMFSNTLGASMSRDLKPYIGQVDANAALWKCDVSTVFKDVNDTFSAQINFPFWHLGGLDRRCTVGNPAVLGSVESGGYVVGIWLARDYDTTTNRRTTVSMTSLSAGGGSRTLQVAEGVEWGDAAVAVQVALFDDSTDAPVAAQWTLDALILPFEAKEPLTT